jgi:DNA repair exonuclease SbcCD ATPase subunit
MEENQVIDAPITEVVAPEVSEPVAQSFTADDLAKARAQEKAKLYPQMEKMAQELEALKKAQAEEAARKAEKAKVREQEKAAKEKQKEVEELSAKELLAKKEQEFQALLEQERLERENAFALLDKERKFQDLMNYRAQRIEQERDNIVPQLIDLVSGGSEEEIEQSIETLKAKSAGIMQDVQQTVLSARQQMPGARITAPASGPLDNDSEQTISTPDSIRDMSMADYAKQRAKLLGSAANNRGQGLFG